MGSIKNDAVNDSILNLNVSSQTTGIHQMAMIKMIEIWFQLPLDGWRTSDEFISLLFWLCLIILIILIKYLVTRLDKANRCIYCYQNSNNAFEKTKKTIKNENGRCNELIITAESSKVCWILKDSLGILNFFLQFTHDSRNVHFINLKTLTWRNIDQIDIPPRCNG